MMLAWISAATIAFLMLVGSIFSLIAAIGVWRFPDLFTRMHAASKAGSVGSGLILLGLAVSAGESPVFIKVLMTISFFLLTSPLSAHLLARAARKSGAKINNLEA